VLAGITGKVYLHPLALAHGFRLAMTMAAAACAAGGVLAGFGIRNGTTRSRRSKGHVVVAPRIVPGYGVSTKTAAAGPDDGHDGSAG
jgi:hypothetical protein